MVRDLIISDLHFGHGGVISGCNRPFRDVTQMNKEMIRRWNYVVRPQDRVFYLGDFIWGDIEAGKEIRKALNGQIIFIMGNHDKNQTRVRSMGFDEVFDFYVYYHKNITYYMSHYPYAPPLFNRIKAKFLGQEIKFLNRRVPKPRQKNIWLLHGHVHNTWGKINRKEQMINISADVWNFTPVTIKNQIRELVWNTV